MFNRSYESLGGVIQVNYLWKYRAQIAGVVALTILVSVAVNLAMRLVLAHEAPVSRSHTAESQASTRAAEVRAERKTPHAYSAACKLAWYKSEVDNGWAQPTDQAYRQAPNGPCVNLVIDINNGGDLTLTQSDVSISAIDSTGVEVNANAAWVRIRSGAAGERIVTWGASKGVHIEWLLATATKTFPAHLGRYNWFPYGPTNTEIVIYANVIGKPTGSPLWLQGFMKTDNNPPLPDP